MILSIDVGIKNLAMCLIDEIGLKIHQWDVSGIPPLHADGIFPNMIKHVDERPWTLQADLVLIENQAVAKKGIQAIENLLHTYFLVKGKKVVIWDARHKIPDMPGAGKIMYNKRKKASIERAREFISKDPNTHWIPIFDKSKKKDDLADTVMQALSFINKKPVAIVDERPKKSNPRKPTENQVRTKYSKANLAYILKMKMPQDARFKRDFSKYYKNIDELNLEFNL